MAEHGPIDVLVNNAGYGLWAPVETYSVEELRDQFETNLFAPVRLIKAVLPGMMEQRRGAIVNVSSYLGRLATPFHSAYASSKFALEGLSESLRTELRPFGIRVAVVEPGVVRTNFRSNQAVPEGVSGRESVYSPHMEVYLRRHAGLERRGTNPVRVARVIHRVIRSRSPWLHHPVGLDARMGMLAARLLPERVLHALVGRVTMG
jgi:short-subunit dehydrogenase